MARIILEVQKAKRSRLIITGDHRQRIVSDRQIGHWRLERSIEDDVDQICADVKFHILQPVGAPAAAAPGYAPAPAYASAPAYAPATTTAGGLQVVAPFAILAGGLVGLSTFLP